MLIRISHDSAAVVLYAAIGGESVESRLVDSEMDHVCRLEVDLVRDRPRDSSYCGVPD
jgi:hypothetical protein